MVLWNLLHEESDVYIQPFSWLTLRPHENQRDLSRTAEVRHLGVVIVDGVETGFVLQTEHKDDRVHPRRELHEERSVSLWVTYSHNKTTGVLQATGGAKN